MFIDQVFYTILKLTTHFFVFSKHKIFILASDEFLVIIDTIFFLTMSSF